MHHKQSSTCSFCGLVPLEDAPLLTRASSKSWEIKAMKAESFLVVCSVCLQSHRSKSWVNRAKSAQSVWIYTQTLPSRAEPFARLTPSVASPNTLHLRSTCTAVQQSTAQTQSTAAGEGDVLTGEKLHPPSGGGNPQNETSWSAKWEGSPAKPSVFCFFSSCSCNGSSPDLV